MRDYSLTLSWFEPCFELGLSAQERGVLSAQWQKSRDKGMGCLANFNPQNYREKLKLGVRMTIAAKLRDFGSISHVLYFYRGFARAQPRSLLMIGSSLIHPCAHERAVNASNSSLAILEDLGIWNADNLGR